MQEIYQIILELTSRKFRMDTLNIAIESSGESYQPCCTYSVFKSQVQCNYTGLIGLVLYVRYSQLALPAYNDVSHTSTSENLLGA